MTRRIGEVAPAGTKLEGQQTKLSELVGTDFTITDARKWKGEDGEYWAVSIDIDGDPFFFFSSHTVVSQQLEEAAGSLPLVATVEIRESDTPGRDYFVLV
jgi:hypothetical protein